MKNNKSVSSKVEINAPASIVWHIITSPEYAKVLGEVFDKNAYVESDWELGSEVFFKYKGKPEKPVNTGKITKLVKEKSIRVDYRFFLFWKYAEIYTITVKDVSTVLQIDAGPYSSDFEEQKIVWRNWLDKVKEICVKEASR